MNSEKTIDVVQTVVKTCGSDEKFLVGLRSRDRLWEFLGGKVEETEGLQEAAIRELNEETGLDLSKEKIEEFRRGESYRSKDDNRYELNPVFIEIDSSMMNKAVDSISEEHVELEWINLENFHKYDTLGQYQVLENLDLIEGNVSIAAVKAEGKVLALKRSEKTSSSGKWNFPGGKIEKDENAEEAVIRELQEETGFKGEIKRTSEPFINQGSLGYWRIFPFLMEIDGKREPELNHEHSEYRWIKPEKLENLETLGTPRALKILGVT